MLAITAKWSQKGSINGSSKEKELGGAAEVLGEVCPGPLRVIANEETAVRREVGLGQRMSWQQEESVR